MGAGLLLLTFYDTLRTDIHQKHVTRASLYAPHLIQIVTLIT